MNTVDESKTKMYLTYINRHDWDELKYNEYIAWYSQVCYNPINETWKIYFTCKPEDMTRLGLQYTFIGLTQYT